VVALGEKALTNGSTTEPRRWVRHRVLHGILACADVGHVIAVAGLAFRSETAEGALFGELADVIGPESAAAVQAIAEGVRAHWVGIFATRSDRRINHRRHRGIG